MSRIAIIAEIGCNHNGDPALARKMVLRARECGVDAVKFQTFDAEALISRYAPKADYQTITTGTRDSQLEMTKKLALSHEAYLELKACAVSLGLGVFSTPFDLASIAFLAETGQRIWKIPSGEITNLPYLETIGALRCAQKQVLLSTGMAEMDEIAAAVDILTRQGTPRDAITILHCTTQYPAADDEVHITAIRDLQRHFPGMRMGFSDHSQGYIAAIAASALGISLIEKHFTLDKTLPGPDHLASADPEELAALCRNIRRVEQMLGQGKKLVTASEKRNRIAARKSIVAKRAIRRGEVLAEENITCKRPGNGISPMRWYELLGTTAERDFCEDALITREDGHA